MNNFFPAWIRGNTRLIAGQIKFWYASCANYQKAVSADVDWTITCLSCEDYTQAEVRCRLTVTLTDPTRSFDRVIFGEDAEKLILFTAAKLEEADEISINVELQLTNSINKHTIACFLRSYDVEFRGQTQRRHSFLKSYTLDEFLPAPPPTMHAETSAATAELITVTLVSSQKFTMKDDMFTPTTKLILKKIAEQTTTIDKGASTSAGVKKVLSFEEKPFENAASIIESNSPPTKAASAGHSLQFPSQTSAPSRKDMQESPSKRAKDSSHIH